MSNNNNASKGWISTLAFRRFRTKMNDTSKIYWTSHLGIKAIDDCLLNQVDDEYAVDVINPNFDRRMFPIKKSELPEWKQDYLNRLRLHLLIIVSATLESYLKDITFLYLGSKGHLVRNINKKKILYLNEIGDALGAPILRRSSVPDPLKYAEKIFEVELGKEIEIWEEAYKKRCIAAHNGGIAVFSSSDDPSITIPEYGLIGIDWEELRRCMKAADDVAAKLDYKATRNKEVRVIEAEQLLRIIHKNKKLPHRSNLWKFLNDNYGIRVNRKSKEELEKMFYISRKMSKSGKSEVKK